MATKDKPPIDAEQALSLGLASSDRALRTVATWLGGLERARHVALTREARRVAARLGDKSDAALLAARQVDAQRSRLAQATRTAGRAAIRLFEVASDAVTIHGRVLDADAGPLEGLTVRITGLRDHGVHDALTSAQGYFRIDLGGDATAATRDVTTGGVQRALGEAADPNALDAQTPPLRLAVLRDGKQLLGDEVTFRVRLGHSYYRELTIEG